MKPAYTICYITNRRDCRFEWFHASLMRQAAGDKRFKLVVVDFYADERPAPMKALADVWTAPKPTVWQGQHRLTSTNYFAPSNARNTGLCLAEGSHITFVDDLSVLMDKWLSLVHRESAKKHKRVLLGRYTKVTDLTVGTNPEYPERYGKVLHYGHWPAGEDSRYQRKRGSGMIRGKGGWMFGSSVCIPIPALLDINGFDEDCDSMGGEDYAAGIMLENRGAEIIYHQGMWTLEDELLHHVEPPFKRIIKPKMGHSTFEEIDASWAYLNRVKRGLIRRADNYCNLSEVRARVLAGEPFPVRTMPDRDWRDNQPLREM